MKKRNKPVSDPHAAREAAKYDSPIPSREFILQLLTDAPGPMGRVEISQQLNLKADEAIEALRRRLKAMVRDGQLHRDRRGDYGIIDQLDLTRGRVMGHRDGFGFVIPADGGDDLFLSHRQMRKVFDGDEVLARTRNIDRQGRREGAIVEVLARNTQQVVGRLSRETGIVFVRPENAKLGHDVMIAQGDEGGAKNGQYVVVEILTQPESRSWPTGRVLEVMGDHMAPGMEIDVAIRNHGIPDLWPSSVQGMAAALPATVDDEDKYERVDLREFPLVTIDGEDARDFDDAVFCDRTADGGFRLIVAIADVSHYVRPGSALDQEAELRGTSVYFPDYVVPMLPEQLSNGLCSLNPKVDRLCMACEMIINPAGRVTGYQFYEAVMHSHARLTYTQVGQMLEERDNKRSGIRKQYHHITEHIDDLHDLYQCLLQARSTRGAIDFDTVETRIIFDDQRKIERIVPVHRNDAHKLIEECMLAANVCAASFLDKHKLHGLYRNHEGPRAEKLENLREFLQELGLGVGTKGDLKPEDYQALLQRIGDRPDAHLIQTVMLRSLSQAKYEPENLGHFGLNYDAYTHFTSPIRRYPDLLVHRALRHVIRSEVPSKLVYRTDAEPIPKSKIYPYGMLELVTLGEHCSMAERRADDATRDVTSWLKCEFLQDHVGDVFEGVVSGVTNFGVFVELKDLYVEGLIHITELPKDYYHFEAAQHRLIGERTRRVFRLGDSLQVKVAAVNLDERKVDFALEGVKTETGKGKGKVKVSAKAKQMADEYQRDNGKKKSAKKSGVKPKAKSKNGGNKTGKKGGKKSRSRR